MLEDPILQGQSLPEGLMAILCFASLSPLLDISQLTRPLSQYLEKFTDWS